MLDNEWGNASIEIVQNDGNTQVLELESSKEKENIDKKPQEDQPKQNLNQHKLTFHHLLHLILLSRVCLTGRVLCSPQYQPLLK